MEVFGVIGVGGNVVESKLEALRGYLGRFNENEDIFLFHRVVFLVTCPPARLVPPRYWS